MSLDFLAAFLGKFEKNEIYTFLVGCAVALSFLLKYVSNNLSQPLYYHVFLFVFLFLLFTGLVYLLSFLLVSFFSYVLKAMLWRKTFLREYLRKSFVESGKKVSILYFPAYRQEVTLYSIIVLIFCGLILAYPNARFVSLMYFGCSWIYYIYLAFMLAGLYVLFRLVWRGFAFELCLEEKLLKFTENKDECFKAVNETIDEAGTQ